MSGALLSKRRWQIRRIFLLRRETYSVAEAVKLLSIPKKELLARMARREIDVDDGQLTWATVAHLAMEQWGLVEIESALGSDASRALPTLFRVEPVTVNLPAYLVRYLYLRAQESGVTIDDQLMWDLHGSVDPNEVDRLDEAIGGFREALFFPG